MAAATAREAAPQPAVTRLAWGLCLLAVVDHTMRPTATSLWPRPSAADSAPSAPLARSRPD